MYSIKRHLEPVLARRFRNNKAILISGPRQTGKSTLCRYLFQDLNQVNLDNALARNQAAEDTALFLKNNRPPVLIDEIQKCPSLFEGIKEYLEAHPDDRSSFVLTGSQKLKLTEGASESLAGRVSVNELQGLSLREITAVDFNRHFVPTEEYFEALPKIDILMLPVGGIYTVDAKEAFRIMEKLHPNITVPMHYMTSSLKFALKGVYEFEKLAGKEPKDIRYELSKTRNAMADIHSRVSDELYKKKQERSKDYER